MINKFLYNSILAVFLILLSSAIIIPDIPVDVEKGKLEISGRIKNEKKKNLDSVLVTVTDSSGRKTLHEFYTDEKGKFKFTLDYNEKVRVYFKDSGYVTMFGTFDTKVPGSKAYKNLYYEASIVLLGASSNFNKQTAKIEPFMKVAYNFGFEIFIEDIDHTFAFLEQVTEPNVGKLTLSGMVQDSTTDSLSVIIEAIDTLGRVVANTKSDAKGRYEIEVPLMSKTRLALISDQHHPSSASIEGLVPSINKEDYYTLKHNFILIPEEERITESVKILLEDNILFDPKKQSFRADTLVRKKYDYAVAVSKRRLSLAGSLVDTSGGRVLPLDIEVFDGNVLYGSYEIDSPNYKIEIPYQSMVRINYKAKGYHPIFVSINTNMELDEMDKTPEFNVPIEMFNKDNTANNADAFLLPVKKFYFESGKESFILDTAASSEFDNILTKEDSEIFDTVGVKGLLMLSAKLINPITKDKISEGRVHILNENKVEVSSILTDNKGKFSTQLDLNKLYFLEFEKEGYHLTRIKIDTKVPLGMENTEISQGGLVAIAVHKDDDINGKIVPVELIENTNIAGYYFDKEEDAFVEDITIYDAFMESIKAYVPPVTDLVPLDTVKEDPLPTVIAMKGTFVDKLNAPISDLDIDFLQEGKKITSTATNENGEYSVELPLDREFTAEMSKKGYYTTTVALNTKVGDKPQIVNKELSLPALKMYQEDDLDANPAAFNKVSSKFVYDPASGTMKSDPKIEQEFEKTLATIPDNQKLALKGKTIDSKGKPIGSAMVMVYEGASLIDSVRSDEKGNYELLLSYQKDYRVVVEDASYYRSYAAVSTKTTATNQRLVDRKVKGLDLVIVNRKEAKVNAMAFLKPFSRVKFDADKNEFVEISEVEEAFMANLFIKPPPAPEKEKKEKKSVKLKTEVLAVKTIIASPILDKDYAPSTTSTAGAERQAQKKTNRNLAAKSELMNDFHDMMKGVQGRKVTSMRNVNLDMKRILNTGYAVSQPPEAEVNENMVKALETRQMLNQIVAEALGFRRSDIPPISTDSIFKLDFNYRIEHSNSGKGVYLIELDRVLQKSKITEYIKETEWWIFDDYYKDGKLISEVEYEKDIAALKKNASSITMN